MVSVCQAVCHHVPVSATRTYGGQPAEQRQAARRERLIAAGRALFVEGGIAKVTVNGVCDRAGLTKRYFYESFGDRDDLLRAVFDQLATEAAGRMFAAAAAASDDPRDRLRIAFEMSIDELIGDLPGLATDETMIRLRAALTAKVVELSTAYAPVIFGERSYDSAEAAMAIQFAIGGAAELVLAWQTGRLDVLRERMVDAAVELILATGNAMLGRIGGEAAREPTE